MNHQIKPRQINAPRGHIGGDTHPCAPVAQGLQRMGALLLRQFTRQRHHLKPAIAHAGQQAVHIGTGLAEHNRRACLVKPQGVENRIVTIPRRHRERAVFDIDVLFCLTLRLDPQGIALKITGQFSNFLRHGGRKHQGATLGRGCIQDIFQIFAKPQIKHFVRFIQHSRAQTRQIERAAVNMVAQTPRRADNDMRAPVQRALFGAVIHTSDTGGNLRTGLPVKPIQLPRDLQRQFAGGGDYQSHRRVGIKQFIRPAQQLIGDGDAKGHGLARPGLRRNQHIAILRLRGQNRHLHSGQSLISLGRQCCSQRCSDAHLYHVVSQWGAPADAPVKCQLNGTSFPIADQPPRRLPRNSRAEGWRIHP